MLFNHKEKHHLVRNNVIVLLSTVEAVNCILHSNGNETALLPSINI